jgi:hypothetical protein
VGLILPLSSISLDQTDTLRAILLNDLGRLWHASFGFRPSKLFEGVNLRLTIILANKGERDRAHIIPGRYMLWSQEERTDLFPRLAYLGEEVVIDDRFPKIDHPLALSVLQKVTANREIIGGFYTKSSTIPLHYHRSPLYWIRAMDFEPYFKSETKERSVHHFRDIHISDTSRAKFAGAILNSTLFYFWFVVMGNCRNLTGDDVKNFPIGKPSEEVISLCGQLFDQLMEDYRQNSEVTVRYNCEYQTFYPSRSKPIIDEIDRALAQHYGFTAEELDFIINYDIKYRMGRDGGAGE